MTKSGAFAIAVSLLFCPADARAAEPARMDNPELSPPPFSNKIPDGLEWEVAIISREESKKAPEQAAGAPLSELDEAEAKRQSIYRERLASRTVRGFHASYARGIRKEILTFGGNVLLERFFRSGLIFYVDAASGQMVIDFREPSASGPVWGVGNFRELSWVCADRYAGVQKFRGKKCHVYRVRATSAVPDVAGFDKSPMPSEEPESLPRGPSEGTTAFIDIETLLPVAMETPEEIWIYKIIGLHSTVLLPDLCAQKLHQLEERGKKLRNKYRVNQ